MAYKVIILYQLYMPSYFLGTFTEYPWNNFNRKIQVCRPDLPLYEKSVFRLLNKIFFISFSTWFLK